jgi:hypothetical protein
MCYCNLQDKTIYKIVYKKYENLSIFFFPHADTGALHTRLDKVFFLQYNINYYNTMVIFLLIDNIIDIEYMSVKQQPS